MNDQSKLDYFIDRTDKSFQTLHQKVDELSQWRWRAEGIQWAVGGVISAVITIIIIVFGGK